MGYISKNYLLVVRNLISCYCSNILVFIVCFCKCSNEGKELIKALYYYVSQNRKQ